MMRLFACSVMAAVAAFASGCGAYYEEVPAFGESDPNLVTQAPQAQPQVKLADNATQLAPVSGQEVNLDAAPAEEYADTDPSALTDFKSTLDPYGTWADDAQYGTVWQPDPGVVGADFEPYVTAGHWAYDSDYTWVSDYDWGWAPFHYGRWVYIPGRGWSWIPGRRYAGAWVSWRVGDPDFDYVGWGPMAPSWYWRDGVAYDIGWGVGTPYVFCPVRDLFSPTLHGRTLAGPQVGAIAGRTHAYVDGRTPAHPTVGPSPARWGLAPPPVSATLAPGIVRARAFGRPSAAMPLGAQRSVHPFYNAYADRPVVTAPQYRGIAPTPYPRRSFGAPMQAYRVAPAIIGRSYGAPPPAYRGGPVYRGGGPAYRGGGPAYRGVTPVQPQYAHPSQATSGGSHAGGAHFGGGGHVGGGHFGGGGGHHR